MLLLQSLKNVLYINLDERPDRKTEVESELEKVGFTSYTRFPAIRMHPGDLGCSISHIECITMARDAGWDYVVVFEDDVVFTNPDLFIGQLEGFLEAHPDDWDFLFLGGNNAGAYSQIDEYCVKVSRCQTSFAYIVRRHYYDTLIECIQSNIEKQMRAESDSGCYAIDMSWFHLQERDRWFLLTPLSLIQRPNYSDIIGCNTDYTKNLLSLEFSFT
jgi:GR25 family glycosyltransferase involved in LPS biosynthesis